MKWWQTSRSQSVTQAAGNRCGHCVRCGRRPLPKAKILDPGEENALPPYSPIGYNVGSFAGLIKHGLPGT